MLERAVNRHTAVASIAVASIISVIHSHKLRLSQRLRRRSSGGDATLVAADLLPQAFSEMAVAKHAYPITLPLLHDDFMRHQQLLPKLHSLQEPSPGPVLTRPEPRTGSYNSVLVFFSFFFSLSQNHVYWFRFSTYKQNWEPLVLGPVLKSINKIQFLLQKSDTIPVCSLVLVLGGYCFFI